jgi:pimeloyl-ACP methyl ester carboxylesterase
VPDLVFLPGFMCDATLWSAVTPHLEHLGAMRFGDVYSDDTLEGMAERVLDGAPDRFVLVGFSMGGFVARVATLMAPERVSGVAFIASSARGDTDADRGRKAARFARPRDAAARPTGVSRAATARGLHPDRETDPVLIDKLRRMQRELGPEVLARQFAVVRRDGYADLERISCPALVVACRQDRLRSYEETERMARHLPRASFETLEDCGHMAPLERPAELAALLAGWIGREGL